MYTLNRETLRLLRDLKLCDQAGVYRDRQTRDPRRLILK